MNVLWCLILWGVLCCLKFSECETHYYVRFAKPMETREAEEYLKMRHIRNLDKEHTQHLFIRDGDENELDQDYKKLQHDNIILVERQEVLHRVTRNIEPHAKESTQNEDKRYVNQHNDMYEEKMNCGRRVGFNDFNDPLYIHQWQMDQKYNNIRQVWLQNITGRGIVVTVLDDGLQKDNPDLIRNYLAEASTDLDDFDDDPTPSIREGNGHGTKCAGVIGAEANNGHCGVGVAYNAKIGGVRLLDGTITDPVESLSFSTNRDIIDIYSASWGPKDDGETIDAPRTLTQFELENGIKLGRNGRGSIYVWATGNGGEKDDCSCDGYVSSIYTLSFTSVSRNGEAMYYAESCPSTLASVFIGWNSGLSSDSKSKCHVVTTDRNAECTTEFQGTSSAAPMAAGCIALLLEANPLLTWRDVIHVVALSSRVTDTADERWIINNGGYHHNRKYGFGVMDCARMVWYAQNMKLVGPMIKYQVEFAKNVEISPSLEYDYMQTFSVEKKSIFFVENVVLELDMDMGDYRRGAISIYLTSPHDTTSIMLDYRPKDFSKKRLTFSFSSMQFWGEICGGEWTFGLLVNEHKMRKPLRIYSATLLIYGMEKRPAFNKKNSNTLLKPIYTDMLEKLSKKFEAPDTLSKLNFAKIMESRHQHYIEKNQETPNDFNIDDFIN